MDYHNEKLLVLIEIMKTMHSVKTGKELVGLEIALMLAMSDLSDAEIADYFDDNYGPISDMLMSIVNYYNTLI